MSDDRPACYAWSPSVPWRAFGIVIGFVLFGASFTPAVNVLGQFLLTVAAIIVVWHGIAGLLRRPRLIITEDELHVRRTFRDHVYPLYTIHGFRVDRANGLVQRLPMLTFDIARVEDWADLRDTYQRTKALPLPLPPMEDRQRDTLEVLSWGDVGVNPLTMMPELEAAGIRNLGG